MQNSNTNHRKKQSVLDEAIGITGPLAKWLIRNGVGYAQFAAELKSVFYQTAEQELHRKNQKITVSALSLTSGLHRKDVKIFTDQVKAGDKCKREIGSAKPSIANQVFTRWITQPNLSRVLPIAGNEASFEALVSVTSKDLHHRAVLKELLRLGVVFVEGKNVSLARDGFSPNPDLHEARLLMAQSVADHLNAGVHNLTLDQQKKFLEQSVFVDGLSAESAQKLNLLSNEIWADALKKITEYATPLCEQDAGVTSSHRFRLGVFSFSELEKQDKEEANHE